jgi:hypothetical protein
MAALGLVLAVAGAGGCAAELPEGTREASRASVLRVRSRTADSLERCLALGRAGDRQAAEDCKQERQGRLAP